MSFDMSRDDIYVFCTIDDVIRTCGMRYQKHVDMTLKVSWTPTLSLRATL
jgi:hypothetical protein